MAEQNEGTEKRQKIHLKRTQWTAAVGLVILVVVLVYAVVKSNSVYTSYEVINTWSRGDDTSVYYRIMNTGMLRYSKDGASMTDKNGNILWNQTYEMSSPILAASSQYIAIGDMEGNSVFVFNEKGKVGQITTDVPIQELKLSNQGVTAAVLADSENNYINLYDIEGELLGSIKAAFENTGYPLTIGLSPDAMTLVVSYLYIDGGTIGTQIVFYDFSNVDGEHILETFVLDGLYPKISFLSSTRVALYGENSFSLYTVSGGVSEFASIFFEDEIKSVFEGDQKMGFIFSNQDENGKYRMEIYDLAGKQTAEVYFDFDYDEVLADDDEIILYNDQEMKIYRYSGRLRFETTLETAVTGVMASWEDGMYWLIDDQSLREIRIE